MAYTTTFRLDATMVTPAIVQGPLTLESLLAAAIFESTGKMRDEALALVPIETMDAAGSRLWLASGVAFNGALRRGFETVTRRRRFTEIGADFYAPRTAWLRKGSDPYAIAQDKGDYKALMNTYPTVHAESLTWVARGNAQACAELLRSLMFVGKRRGQGFGELGEVTVREVDEHPLIDADGLVRRPVPVELLPFIPGAADLSLQRLAHVVTQHPSWAHPAVLCAVPALDESMPLAEAQPPARPSTEEIYYD